MLKQTLGFFSHDLAIDLGTANTLIYIRHKGIVLNEPSVVAVKTSADGVGKQVIAVGDEAQRMLGRTPQGIQAIRPLKDGVIADFDITESMLKFFIRKVQANRFFSSPRIVICVPCGGTQVEGRAIRDSAISAGARKVYLLEEAMAVAIGAGLSVSQPIGTMVVDIGGGTTEVAVLSLGGMVYSDSLRIAGDAFNAAIVNHLRRKHQVIVGLVTAERIKHSIATTWHQAKHMEMEIKGRDMSEGISRTIKIDSEELCEALEDNMAQIVLAARTAMEMAPPEIGADIGERGIILAGGGALVRDIDKRLSRDIGVPVSVLEDPMTCVVNGCGRALENLDAYKDIFSEQY